MNKTEKIEKTDNVKGPIRLLREGSIGVFLKACRQNKEKSWEFNAVTPMEAISFAESLCAEHGMSFKRDTVEWTFGKELAQ